MFLRDKSSSDLVEVLDMTALMDPNQESVSVSRHAGEEKGDPVDARKSELVFPSGETLPVCWVDAHYRVNF
ncbi:MAG: acetyltransferase [Mariprofundaceae bacterium]|nr:acetyltransferase [Mariprofundaceae bacterium]